MSPVEHVSGGDTALLPRISTHGGAGALTLIALDGSSDRNVRVDRAVTLGRDPSCDLLAAGHGVSRFHARINPGQDAAYIEDLDSLNGTFVNGRRVARAQLDDGAVLRLGDTLLCLRRLVDSFAAATSAGPMVGGTALSSIRRQITLVGPTDLPTHVTGETGTGKEITARLLHEASGRSGPFLAVNCAALPQNLVESELFGHVKGAFTGAQQARSGLFRAAHGGTLFLDEIGELPLSAQAVLLRVLEEGVVRAVGAETERRVDVRIVSATNRDLRSDVADKLFRADLFARLAAVELRLPPLRERREDIPALVAHLLSRTHRSELAVAPDALEALLLYDWPQNIRELDNVLRGAAVEAVDQINFDQLPERVQRPLLAARNCATEAERPVPQNQKEALHAALLQHSGNVRQVAKTLGVARGHVYRLLKRWDLDPGDFRKRHAPCSEEPQ